MVTSVAFGKLNPCVSCLKEFFSGFFKQLHKLRSLRRSFLHFDFISAVHIWFISYIINSKFTGALGVPSGRDGGKRGKTIVVELLISNIYIKLQEEALSRLYYYYYYLFFFFILFYFFFTAKAALASLGSFILVHLSLRAARGRRCKCRPCLQSRWKSPALTRTWRRIWCFGAGKFHGLVSSPAWSVLHIDRSRTNGWFLFTAVRCCSSILLVPDQIIISQNNEKNRI